MPQDPFDDIVRGYDQQLAPPKLKPAKSAKKPSFDDLVKDVDGQPGSVSSFDKFQYPKNPRVGQTVPLRGGIKMTYTGGTKEPPTLSDARMGWTGEETDAQGRPTGRMVHHKPKAATGHFQSPIDLRLNAPNEAQKAFDRAAEAVKPAPIAPKPELRTKQTLGQMKQRARNLPPTTQEDILRNPITPEERKASSEQFLTEQALDKQRQQAAAKAKLEEEASRASQSTLGKMGTRFARGAVRGVTQTPFEFVQMANPDPVVRQTMGRIADDSKEWQSQNLPVDNRNPATLNVFKPEFYSLENVGKAATENIPEVLGEMLPQIALARGAGGIARLAAPELAAATVPRMASTTGAQLAARTAAGGYGAAQQSTQAYQKAIAAGMTHEQAQRAAAIEAPIGFSEFLGSPGTTGFTRPGTAVRREMREEGLQELSQTAASGLAGKYASGYDANKPLTDIAGESIGSGLLGAATGGIVATPGARLQARQQASQQRATRSAIDQRSAANAAAIAPQSAAQSVTDPSAEPMAAQPQPSAPVTPQVQPQGFPRLPEPEGFNARRAKLLGIPTPAEVNINEQVQAAAQLLDSPNEGDQRQGRRMMNQALMNLRKAEGYLAEASLPPDAERPFTAVRDAIEARLKPAPKVKVEVATPTAANALRAEADAAKIKAAEFEQVGDFTQAAATYQAAHQNLKRLRRSMGQPKTPEAVAQISQIDREISIADANRRKAMQAARTAQRQANAPPAGLPQNPQSAIRNPQSTEAPLLRPEAVQNPEGGIPQMPEQTFSGRLDQGIRKQDAQKPSAPAKRLISRIQELGGISNRYGGELQGVRDARGIGIVRNKAEMSPDILARQLQSEGYDIDPENLDTLWRAIDRDVANKNERPANTNDLNQRLKDEEAEYYAQQEEVARRDVKQSFSFTDASSYKERNIDGDLVDVPFNEGDGAWTVEDSLGGKARGELVNGVADIVGMQSIPQSKKYTSEASSFKRRGFFRSLIQTLQANGAKSIRIDMQSSDTKAAIQRLLQTGELVNPREIRGSSTAEHPTLFDIPLSTTDFSRQDSEPTKSFDQIDEEVRVEFKPDTADLREVREFAKREPRSEQFTDEPPTAPLARRRQPIRPPAPASPRQVGNRPLSVDVAGTRTPTAMSPEFPRARREMVKQGREVEAQLTEGQDKGEFGNVAEAMFKSNTPGVLHGQDSFFHDPDLKGKLGLTREAEMADVRRELKTQLARSLGLSADEVSLSHIKPEVWRAWAKQKGLGREAVRKLEAGIARAERKQRATETNAAIVAEESQRAQSEVREPAGKTARPAKSIDAQIKDIRDLQKFGLIDDREAKQKIAALEAQRPKIAERRSEAMPERYTGRQLFENAQLTFRPARNRPATLVANDWGGAMLNRLLSEKFDVTTTDANFTFGAKDAKDLRDYLAEAKDSGIYEPAQVANMDAMLKQMDAAIADAEANQQDVAFVTRRPAEPISATKAKIRHEAAHLSQSRIAADLSALTGKNWLDSQPNAKDIHKELDRRGYAPETHDYEAAAFVASGDYGVFGMNLDQAAKFLSDYFGAVIEKHGKRALQKFGAIDPKLQPILEAQRETEAGRTENQRRSSEAAQKNERRIGAASETGGSRAGVLARRQESDTGDAGTPATGETGRRTRASVENSPEFKRWFGDSKVVDKNGKPLVVYHGTQSPVVISELDYSKLDPNALYGPGFYTTQDPNVAASDDGGYALNKGDNLENAHAYKLYLRIKNPLDINNYYSPRKTPGQLEIPAKLKSVLPSPIRIMSGQGIYEALVEEYGSKAEANLILQAAGFDGITHLGGVNNDRFAPRFKTFEDAKKAEDVRGGRAVALVPGDKFDKSLPKNIPQILSDNVDDIEYVVSGHRVWIAFYPEQIKSATGNRGTFDPTSPKITERKDSGLSPARRGQVLASGLGAFQNLFERDAKPKEVKPTRPVPLPRNFNLADWSQRLYRDAMAAGLPKDARAKYDAAKTVREKNVILMESKLDSARESQIFDLIDRAQAAAEKNDGSALYDVLSDATDLMRKTPERGLKRVGQEVGNLVSLPRAIMASADVSAPLRQGAILTLPPSQWGKAAKATVRMFQAFNTAKYKEIGKEINLHEDAETARESGLYLSTDKSGLLLKKEEDFISSWADKIPLVKQSEQAYKTYLDSLRMDSFARYKKSIDKTKGLTEEQKQNAYKAAAEWINTATGRGSLGSHFESAMPILSKTLFAPRYAASRIQVLNPYTYAKNSRTPEGRAVLKNQMSDMVQYAGMVSLTLALASAAGASVGLEPDDPDFLKIKVGQTRYDVLAGLQQPMRLFYRIGDALRRRVTGKKAASRQTAVDIAARYGRSKLAPVPSFFLDYVTGKDFIGRDFEMKRAVLDRVVPLMWKDMADAYEKEGLQGAAKVLPAAFGIGVQNYAEKTGALKGSRFTKEAEARGLKYDFIRQKVGEPEAVYKQRVQRVEGWMSEYGDKLLSHPRYGTLTEAQQEAAIENLRRRIGTQQNATRPRLDSFAPEKVIQSVLKSEATRPKRDAGKLWSPPANRP